MLLAEDRRQKVNISAAWNGTGTAPAGSVVNISAAAGSILAVQVSGTFTATLQFEGRIAETDDVNDWFAITGIPAAGGSTITSATAAGRWFFQYAGLRAARVRCSAYTSGTPVVTMNISAGAPAGGAAGAAGGAGGAVTQGTTPWVVAGGLTNNNAAPGAANVGVLPAIANAASPTYTEGDQVLLSTDLTGLLRAKVAGFQASGTAVASNPILVGLNGSGALVRYAVDAVAGFPTTGTGVAAVHHGVFDGTNFQKSLQVSQATGTTGVGLPAAGPLLWDSAGATNFIKQAGNARGEAITVSGGLTPSAPTCTFTRGANTTAYTIGDEVGTSGTAPTTVSVARFNGGSGVILGAQVVYSGYAATVPQLVVLLFSATVTLAGDNAQLNLSDGDAALMIGYIPLTASQSGQYSAGAPVSAGNTIFQGAPTAPIEFTAGGSQQTIYAALITLNAFTPIANSETLILTLRAEQN